MLGANLLAGVHQIHCPPSGGTVGLDKHIDAGRGSHAAHRDVNVFCQASGVGFALFHSFYEEIIDVDCH